LLIDALKNIHRQTRSCRVINSNYARKQTRARLMPICSFQRYARDGWGLTRERK